MSAIHLSRLSHEWVEIESQESALQVRKTAVWEETRRTLIRLGFLSEFGDDVEHEYQGEVVVSRDSFGYEAILYIEVAGLFLVKTTILTGPFSMGEGPFPVGSWVRFKAQLSRLEKKRHLGRGRKLPVLCGVLMSDISRIKRPNT